MELIYIYEKKKKIGGNGLGAKRLGLGGETTRVGGETTRGPKRGRNDQGGNVLGAKRLVTEMTLSINRESINITISHFLPCFI